MKQEIELRVNGQIYEVEVQPWRTLLEVLRDKLHLTGTKQSCGEGHCGACTVLVNNESVRSCITAMDEVRGKEVTTIEGLAKGNDLHPLQKAFIKHDAMQCGFCTSGMILTAHGFLIENPDPDESGIINAMDNNLCRCGSYKRILEAVKAAAKEMKGGVKK